MRSSTPPAKQADQRAVIGFLGRPSSYGPEIDRVEHIETMVSQIFLAGDRAYKLKRAIKLPYLDFSTAEQRHAACAAELALNRRTAPSLYLNLRRLGHDAAGKIAFVNEGPAIDWVVVMKRFDQGSLFDYLAQKGGLDGPLIDALADRIAQFHSIAEQRPDQGGTAALGGIAETSHQLLLAAFPDDIFTAGRVGAILDKWRQSLATETALIEARRAAGKVRRCHGDLHLRNICLVDGKPTLFDCLEFSEQLGSIDILYDFAFLLMDLEHRGLAHFANRALNRYLDRAEEDDGLGAMPLFLSLRAGIRAHVTAAGSQTPANRDKKAEMAEEARRYLDLACQVLEPQPCRLVAIGGLSGSGKSTLAAGLAPELGRRPGARVLRSDVTRKLTLGTDPETRLPAEAYTADITRRVYDTLQAKAATVLAAGYTAIIDAVSLLAEERQAFAQVAAKAGVPFTGIWLEADADAMAERIRERRGDASDATAEVLARQLQQDPGPMNWTRIDARGSPDQCLASARRAIAQA